MVIAFYQSTYNLCPSQGKTCASLAGAAIIRSMATMGQRRPPMLRDVLTIKLILK